MPKKKTPAEEKGAAQAPASVEPEPLLNVWSQAVARVMWESFDVASSVTSHSLLLGDSRETFVRDVVSKIVPPNVYLGQGQIADRQGNYSKQIDVVVYRSDFPIFRTMGSADVFLLDGVLATIEVKSSLNPATLCEAVQNCYSVSNLKLNVLASSIEEFALKLFKKGLKDLSPPEHEYVMASMFPPTYVFGFTGYKSRLADFVTSIEEAIQTLEPGCIPPLGRLPAVLAAENCVAVTNRRGFFDYASGSQVYGYLASKTGRDRGSKAPASLTFLLAHLLNTILRMTPDRVHKETGVRYVVENWVRPPTTSEKWVPVGPYLITEKESFEADISI